MTSKIKYNIEKIVIDQKNGTEIWGWIIDLQQKNPLKFIIDECHSDDFEIYQLVRNDIAEKYNKHDGKFGFKILLEPEFKGRKITLSFPDRTEKIQIDISKEKDLSKSAVTKVIHTLVVLKKYIKSMYKNGSQFANKELKLAWWKKRHRIDDAYEAWIVQNEMYDINDLNATIQSFDCCPKISIVVPVYNVEEKWLRLCIESVQQQYYTNWELCFADDCSTESHVRQILDEYTSIDQRINVVYRKTNGHISKATNTAIDIATGDYIAFMDNDDEIPPYCLYECVKKINEHRDTDFIYTDEDKIDTKGKRFDPFFKPDWNPRLLLSHNYITHFVMVKRELIEEIGKLESSMNGAQDYDFVLRATEKANSIIHINRILYHWRTIENSTAMNPEAKNYAYIAGQHAVENALMRRGYKDYRVSIGDLFGTYKINFCGFKNQEVSIILYNVKSEDSLTRTILEIFKVTSYDNYQLICSKKHYKILGHLPSQVCKNRILWVDDDMIDKKEQLNALVNRASGEYLCFIEDGFLPTKPNWIQKYFDEITIDKTAAVGAKLLSKDRVFSAGLSFDDRSRLYYSHYFEEAHVHGYYFRLVLAQNVYAIPLCGMFIAKKTVAEKDGFAYDGVFGALDLCLKIRTEDAYIAWTPEVVLDSSEARYHDEDWFGSMEEMFLKQYSQANHLFDPYTSHFYSNIDFKERV